MYQFLPYLVVRHAAADLDRQGVRPSRVLTVLVGIASAGALGALACAAVAVGWTALALVGVVT